MLLFAQAKVTAATIVQLLQRVLAVVQPDTLLAMLEAMGGHYARSAAPGRRPAKLPNDPANAALVAHLQSVGDVSTFGPSQDGKTIKVNMKRQWLAADTSGSV